MNLKNYLSKRNILFFALILFCRMSSFGQQWQTLASLPVNLAQHAAAAYDGKIYVINGTQDAATTTQSLRIYDIQANTWSTGNAPIGVQTRGGDAASDGTGNIYFATGVGTGEKKVFKYVISSGTWSEIPGSTLKTAWNGTLEYHNGKLYHLGGEGSLTVLNIYNISTNTWSTGTSIPNNGGMFHASAVIGDKIYMIGGGTDYTAVTQTVKVYDIPSNTWSVLPSSANFPQTAYYFDAVPYLGEIYLTGGSNTGTNQGGSQFDYYYKFKPSTGTWESLTSLPSGQGQHTLVESNSKLYSIGGYNSNSVRSYVYSSVLAFGGTISGNQTFCPEISPYDPTAFTSVTGASGGSNSFSYQWEISTDGSNWNTILGATNIVFDVPSSDAISATTYYRRKATDGNSVSVYSNILTVSKLIPLSITSQPSLSPQTLCKGAVSTALTVSALGNNLSYQWYSNLQNTNSGGTTINGATTSSYTPPTNTATNTYYYCVVSDAAGCNPSSITSTVSGLITVNELPGVVLGTISNIQNSATTFNIPFNSLTNGANQYSVISGTSALSSFTAVNNATISGTTGNFVIPIPQNSLNGTYDFLITVKNSNSSCISPSINRLFSIASIPSIQASNIQISSRGTTSAALSWINGNGAGRAVFVKLGNIGTASPALNVNYTANTTFGLGSQIGSTGWYCVYIGTGTSVNVTGLTSGNDYQIMVTEFNGTTNTYSFNNSQSNNNPVTLQNLSVSTSNLTFTECLNTISNSQTFTVSTSNSNAETVITAPNGFEVSNALNTGYGSFITLIGSGVVTTTSVFVRMTAVSSGTPSGSIVVSSSGAASVNVAVSGTINPSTAITTQPTSPSNVCLNGTASIASLTASGQNLGYQWYSNTANSTVGSTAISGAISTTYTIPTTTAGTTYYYAVVTGQCGTAVTSSIISQTIDTSIFTTDVSSVDQTYNIGATASALTVNSPGATSYQWYSTPSNPSLLNGFTSTAGFTSSTGSFQTFALYSGGNPAITGGVLTFAYVDGSNVYRDFALDPTATTVTFSTQYAETDPNNNRAGDVGKIQLIFYNASNVQVGQTVESPQFTGTLTFQNVSLSNVAIPSGATKVRAVFYQVSETEYWAGNYGISFKNPVVSTNVALSGTAISGANSATYTPSTNSVSSLYFYAEALGGCSTATSSISGLISVVKPNPVITAMPAVSKVFGAPAFTLTDPASTSTGAFTYTSSNTAVATIIGNEVTIVGAGTAVISANQTATAAYSSGSVTFNLTVTKASRTLTGFSANIDKVYGSSAFVLPTITRSAGTGSIIYTSSNSSVAIVNGTTIIIVGAGTATINANIAADANYGSATTSTLLTVSKAPRTISGLSPTIAKTFTDPSFNLTTTLSAGTGSVTYTSSNTSVATINGSTVTIVGAGTATITASVAAAANYGSATTSTLLTVSKAPRTISGLATAITKTVGDPSFDLTTTLSAGTGTITYASSNTSVATVSGSTISIVGAGTATITASVASNANYQAATASSALTVQVGDTDGDGVSDSQEAIDGTDPNSASSFKDTDGDGVPDVVEVADGTNPTSGGDAKDSDGDGVPDYVEVKQGTSPTNASDTKDTDGDGVPDYIEVQQGTSPTTVADTKDTDGDGVSDYIERLQGTNPNTAGDIVIDTDGDGVPDYIEVQQGTSPISTNDAKDTDGDGVPDYIEMKQGTNVNAPGDNVKDTDGDGVPDYIELQQGTSPTTATDAKDTDGDGIPDYIEVKQGTNPAVAGDAKDTDGDGIPDFIEVLQGTNPAVAGDQLKDTDGDGVPDYIEVQQGTSPTTATDAKDSDGDGVPDYIEVKQGTSPTLATDAKDSDGDGVPDFIELQQGTSPTTANDAKDSDGDGVPDYIEVKQGTNPTVAYDGKDTDGDGIPDYVEIAAGLDPNDASSAVDSDGDGVPDYVEKKEGTNPNDAKSVKDADGDGVPDYIEIYQGTNPNSASSFADADGDGISDVEEGYSRIKGANIPDLDGDGIPDYRDTDCDGDGILDVNEDNLNLGALPDCDNDGIPNRLDRDVCVTFTPQGISPNGDGENDVLLVPGVLATQPNKLTVYNRSGMVVYEQSNYQNDWSGTTNSGDLLPDGVYYYVVDFFGVKPTVNTFIYISRLAQ